MKTAPELEDTLSDVILLIEQQRYHEALSILGDLTKKNPADREIWMYRLLIKRILTLQYALSRRNTRSGEYFRAMAAVLARGGSALRILKLRKLRQIFVRYRHLARTWLGNRHSQLQSELAKFRKEMDQMREQNHELLSKIKSLSSKLAASEGTVAELQTIKKDTESNTQRLYAMNRQLQQEVAAIRNQIQTSETRVSGPARQNQDAGQIDITGLKKGLEENEANFRTYLEVNFRALDGMRQELATVQSQEMIFTEQQSELKTQMAGLQRELSARKIEEKYVTHKRLEKVEHVAQELCEENRRLKQEIAGWRKQLAVSEENERQVSALLRQLEELQNATPPSSADSTAALRVSNKQEIKPAVWSSRKGRSRLGVMPATGVIAATAAVAIAFLSISSDRFSGSKQSAVELRQISSEQLRPPEAGFEPSARVTPAPLVRGTFETTHKTELFNGPSENAALIGSIRAGMRIRVVDSRDGWLEILTKHGRRGAFLRQEAAVRIDRN
ncbi:MAG TPA: hypothetical protein VFM35_02890 [Candidatus Binatia bacterium]|nr:hypothetical protein [Candidatus Binatia bacterium]